MGNYGCQRPLVSIPMGNQALAGGTGHPTPPCPANGQGHGAREMEQPGTGRPPGHRRPSPRGGRCQTACKPGSVPRVPGGWPFIWDSRRRLPRATCPDGGAETRPGARRPPLPSLFGLAPGEACRAAPVARRAVRSYRTLSPLPRRGGAVCFLWRCLGGRPRRALPGTVFPWSPDFPHPAGFPRWQGAAIRPSGPVNIVARPGRVKASAARNPAPGSRGPAVAGFRRRWRRRRRARRFPGRACR